MKIENSDAKSKTDEALGLVQAKVQCKNCYWYMSRLLEDWEFSSRIELMLREAGRNTLAKYYFKRCFQREFNDIGERFGLLTAEASKPPRQPNPRKHRFCKYFLSSWDVMKSGGGIAVGIWREESKYARLKREGDKNED